MNTNKNISQEEFESIERYLTNAMTPEEHLAFKQRLKKDTILQNFVTENKVLFEAVETQSLKEQLDIYHAQIPKRKSINVSALQFRKIAVAAALIIAAGSFWLLGNSSNEKLFTKYFTPDPGLSTTMSSTNNFEFYDAMVNYKHGDYETAIKKWQKLHINNSQNDTLNYFLGIAYLANNNNNKAISFLSNVTKTSKSVFKNDAYYYLGLAYLKADNMQLAKKNLTFSTIDNSKSVLSELND